MEVEEMLREYKKLKDELNQLNNGKSNNDFVNLLNLENIDPELKKFLILLHSNYDTELKDTKAIIYNNLYKVIDESEIMVRTMHNRLKESESKILDVEKGDKKNNRRIWTMGIVLLFILALFGMASFNPAAYDRVVGSLKHVLGFTTGLVGNTPFMDPYQRPATTGAEQQPNPAPEGE